jgi:rare lipoprotein A
MMWYAIGVRTVMLMALAIALAACGPRAKPARTAASTPPATSHAGDVQRGMATWYASGTMTASGERYDKRGMTAAHRTLPFGSIVKVTHRKSGRSVKLRINDRGPFGSKRRIIDVSEAAAEKLGIIDEGVAPVTVEVLVRGKGRRKK